MNPYIKKRRQHNELTRENSLQFVDNRLPAHMKVEDIQRLIQLQMQATKPRELGSELVVPDATKGMIRAAEYNLNQRTAGLQKSAEQEVREFTAYLKTEKTEVVYFQGEDTFFSSLNGVPYYVVPRRRMKLPRTLARHFREKLGLEDMALEYSDSMEIDNLVSEDEDLPDFKAFKKAVEGLSTMEWDAGYRTEVF